MWPPPLRPGAGQIRSLAIGLDEFASQDGVGLGTQFSARGLVRSWHAQSQLLSRAAPKPQRHSGEGDYSQQAWTYRQKASPYQYLRIEGQYLYGQTSPDTGTSVLQYGGYQTGSGTVASASAQLTCDVNDPIVVNYNPGSSSAGCREKAG